MKDNFTDINNSLLVKHLLGETAPEEAQLVERWLAVEEANRTYYEHFRLIWEQSGQYRTTGSINEEAAWTRFQHRIHNHPQKLRATKHIFRSFGWLRLAAIFVLAVAGAWLTFQFMNKQTVKTKVSQAWKTSQIDTLPDGSVITLNKNSLIRYPEKFTGGTRRISLEGEAFFKISPDREKPFVIQINDVSVRVVGTSFNVKSFNGNTEVIVETGIVQVIKNHHSIRLAPKEKTIVHPSDSILVKQLVTDKLYNYYRTKTFYCDNTPLWKLVQALNEEYNVNIIIARKDIRALKLSTEFNDEPLDKILTILGETFNISITRSGDQIILQ